MSSAQRPGSFWVAVLLLLTVGPAPAQREPVFQSGWEQAAWRVERKPGLCLLVHDVARFGAARFEQRSGRQLSFSLAAEQPLTGERKVSIIARAPAWNHHVKPYSLGAFVPSPDTLPIRLPHEQAARVYYGLEQGMQPVIRISGPGNIGHPVQVALSPLRFRSALPAFAACTSDLPDLDPEQFEEQVVLFSTGSNRLSRDARRVLEAIALAWHRQPDARIVLSGHADERGDPAYNMHLSRRRVGSVARYLRAQGVPARAIESRYFGETRPIVVESNRRAWIQNRRVTIRLAV